MIRIAGQSIALLGYVCATTHPSEQDRDATALLDEATILSDIARCLEQAVDRIVINLHWGEEGCRLPRPADAALAHKLVDAGADLIVGHHSHCTQGYEIYRGRYIVYGLGNCIFPDFDVVIWDSIKGLQRTSRCVWRRWNNQSIAIRYHPATNHCEVIALQLMNNKRLVIKGMVRGREIRTTAPNFHRRYERARVWGHLRYALNRFLARPRVPHLRTFVTLGRWIKVAFEQSR